MSLELENVVSFCNEVKTAFVDKPHLYEQFMDSVGRYANAEIDMFQMLRSLSQLFGCYPHLKDRFVQFLPPGMTLENYNSYFGCRLQDVQRNKPNWYLAECAKHGTYKDFAFFDKVRHLLGNEDTYLNFLRCLSLYTKDAVSGPDLVDILQPFLHKEPALMTELRTMLRCDVDHCTNGRFAHRASLSRMRPRRSSQTTMELDYASSKKLGISYRALPASYEQPGCTGRTLPGNELCNEVLNDIWVSFPLWSEDTTSDASKMSQYEEFLYRCEDERYELDIVIDNVAATVVALEGVQMKLIKMTSEEVNSFQLDPLLGGSSEVLQRKSIERIYGDKAVDMIDGLIRKPCVAIPIVLRRLRAKLEEWREARKRFNQLWREQHDKSHGKWLQSQAAAFRQTDARMMRTRTLLNEAETAAEELEAYGARPAGRQLELNFNDKMGLRDATSLIIHYLNYLPSGQTDDSFRVSKFLVDMLPELIEMPAVSEPRQAKNRVNKCGDELYTLMYTNSSWYLFLRLFHMFCERLREVRRLANGLQRNGSGPALESLRRAKCYYAFVLNTIRGMIEGTIDVLSYENELRRVLGTSAYIAFTVEKILQNIVRQLQHLVGDDVCRELMDLFNAERQRGGAGGSVGTAQHRRHAELAYRRRATRILADDYCFKILFYKNAGRIAMELVDTEAETMADDQMLLYYRTTNYIQQYIDPDQASCRADLLKPVFLSRTLQDCDHNDLSSLSIVDNVHCHFAPFSPKMSFVANSFSFLYRPQSLMHSRQRHHTLSVIKRRKFKRWWSTWQARHVTADQERRYREWVNPTTSPGLPLVRSIGRGRGRTKEK